MNTTRLISSGLVFTQRLAYSPLHPLINALPQVALQVDDLQKVLTGKETGLKPCELIEGLPVAIINDHGVPIERL